MSVLVSINCITYNHELYIAQAIEGFLMQKTDFDYEILIHDDASTDNTANIIKTYAEKYPDIIKPILQTENQYSKRIRISPTFNWPRSKGRYIAVCEGDDYWIDPYKLQKQVDYMEKYPDCTLCFHGAKVISAGDNRVINHVLPFTKNKKCSTEVIVERDADLCPTASLLYRKSAIKDYPDFAFKSPVGDYPLQMIVASKGYAYYINEIMSVYRRGSEGSWANRMYSDTPDNQVKFYSSIIDLLNNFNKYTDCEFNNSVEKTKLLYEIKIHFVNKDMEELKHKKYKKVIATYGVKRKLKFMIRIYAPRLHKRLSSLKYKLVTKRKGK